MTVQITGTFDSSTTKSNGQQNMRLKFPYSEIANYSKLLMLLGTTVKAVIVNDDDEKIKLGNIMIDKLTIDKDGEAKLSIIGETSNIDMANICSIIEKVVVIKIKSDGGEE